jgi:tRNA dimethylallyltransferase
MKSTKLHKIIVIVGPTTSGKSDLGVRLAHKVNGEIISADSRQVYKGLDIGAGKITKKEMRGIVHYGLNIASPRTIFTAEDFKNYGEEALNTIFAKKKIPIIVGGTGFYIDVLLGRMETASVPPNPKFRKQLEKKNASQLFMILKKLDPLRTQTIDKNNPRRLVRAIEIERAERNIKHSLAAGFEPEAGRFPTKGGESVGLIPERIRWDERGKREAMFDVLWLGINHAPEKLKKRIHLRLIKRFDGIVKEIKSLHSKGVSWKRMNDLGLEYRYVSELVQKKKTKNETIQKLDTEIWRYARRQMTWFRRNKKIHWVKTKKDSVKLIKTFISR